MQYYSETPEKVLAELKSSEKGLTQNEAGRRLEKYGRNELKKKGGIGPAGIFLSQFASPLVIILIAAAAIAFFLGERKDSAVIGAVVAINAVIGFIQEFKAEKALEALMKMIAPKARVIRNGKESVIDARLAVPGDVIVFEAGDRVAADARIFECYEVQAQEAALTGESSPVCKTAEAISGQNIAVGDMRNLIFAGTSISSGSGKAVVTSTGMNTEFGKVAKLTQEVRKEATPLQKELSRAGRFIGAAVIAICAVVFVIILLRAGVLSKNVVVEGFIFAVALAVAAVPEGLLATVTVSLALGMRRMVRKNAIVKRLNSVETLGSTTVICSDKTGTLTKNEMTVKEIYADGRLTEVSGVGYEPEGEFSSGNKVLGKEALARMGLMFSIGALCNNSSLEQSKGRWGITGDPTEAALIAASYKAGFRKQQLAEKYRKLYEFPFDSARKMMSVIVKSDGGAQAFVKGAPSEVIKRCDRILVNGKETRLTEAKRKELLRKDDEMASKALRVLALAYRKVNANGRYRIEDAEKGLTFAGLAGMIDPPREGVKESVALCRKAGIRVIVITGDHGTTARAIAQKVGIATEHTPVIEGTALDRMGEKQLHRALEHDPIFARVSPDHKLRIVKALEKMGQIVAVTGDGVNDAPALKKASIGVAMGITGTDVSQEAADMVLADDSFSTIVTAVEEGRSIYSNIQKFMRYLFSSNLGEIVLIFLAMIAGLPYPVLAVQILWINLVTDVFPALALAVEPPEPDIMERKPRDPKKKMITTKIFLRWLEAGAVIGIGTLAVFIVYLLKGGWAFGAAETVQNPAYLKALTMSFTVLVVFQLVNVFNCRSDDKTLSRLGLFTNKWLIMGVLGSLMLQIIVVHSGFFQKAFYTVALSPFEWVIVILAALTIFAYDEIGKSFRKRLADRRVC